LLKNKKDKMT
jgi:ATP synthase subunit 6